MLVICAVLALVSAVTNGVSSVLQRKGARATGSEETIDIEALRQLVRTPVWVVGIVATVVGFLLQAGALASGPIVLVQPILALELPVTLMVGIVVFHSTLHRREWVAVWGMTAGLGLLVAALMPAGGDPLGAPVLAWVLASAVNLALVAALTTLGLRRRHAARAALLGTAAGAGFAFTAALVAGITDSFEEGWAGVFGAWQTYAMLVAGPAGFFMLQNALRAGRLAASQPGLTLTNPLVSLGWGVAVFDEKVRGGPWAVAEVVGAAAVAACTVLLARSPLLEGVKGGSESDLDRRAGRRRR